MTIEIDSDGGFITLGSRGILGDLGISWGNSQDPFFADLRLEGFFSINLGPLSIEFGAIDQERPGLYITRYRNGDIEFTKPLLQF